MLLSHYQYESQSVPFEEGQFYIPSSRPSGFPKLSKPHPLASQWWIYNSVQLANLPLLSRLFGFLLGSTLAGAGVYYYILEEYKVSNELLTEDIYVRLCI